MDLQRCLNRGRIFGSMLATGRTKDNFRFGKVPYSLGIKSHFRGPIVSNMAVNKRASQVAINVCNEKMTNKKHYCYLPAFTKSENTENSYNTLTHTIH